MASHRGLDYPAVHGDRLHACVAAVKGRGSTELVAAVRAYDWDAAQMLAATEEEKEDVEFSALRVGAMQQLTRECRFEEALQLAVMQVEVDAIYAAAAAADGGGAEEAKGEAAVWGRGQLVMFSVPAGVSPGDVLSVELAGAAYRSAASGVCACVCAV